MDRSLSATSACGAPMLAHRRGCRQPASRLMTRASFGCSRPSSPSIVTTSLPSVALLPARLLLSASHCGSSLMQCTHHFDFLQPCFVSMRARVDQLKHPHTRSYNTRPHLLTQEISAPSKATSGQRLESLPCAEDRHWRAICAQSCSGLQARGSSAGCRRQTFWVSLEPETRANASRAVANSV